MGFARESEMGLAVHRWLRRERVDVKEEFALPWGICDFVGVRFNPIQVTKRLKCGQNRAIGPLRRVKLLMHIPDHESGRGVSLSQLRREWRTVNTGLNVEDEVKRLIADHFVIRNSNGLLQRLNGWAPLHHRIIAVELKLSRASEALEQAATHRIFATESYVAMPAEIARRVASGVRSSQFRDAGVGIIAVTPNRCSIVLPVYGPGINPEPTLQMHCVERFWRSKDSSS